ncbi:hypothetical protein Scep_010117 [Stephania cephalantha]|uniref:Uncharacterized protein n=1 Tax=Stephania cephalantha TaxID=152367 RepID=A0AAP0JUE7_9MAGN
MSSRTSVNPLKPKCRDHVSFRHNSSEINVHFINLDISNIRLVVQTRIAMILIFLMTTILGPMTLFSTYPAASLDFLKILPLRCKLFGGCTSFEILLLEFLNFGIASFHHVCLCINVTSFHLVSFPMIFFNP